VSGDEQGHAGEARPWLYDPAQVEPEPMRKFEVGDRIQIGEHVVTVTAVHPAATVNDGTRYTVSS
jgi:hypothetical protein